MGLLPVTAKECLQFVKQFYLDFPLRCPLMKPNRCLKNDTEMAPRQTMLVKGDDGILIEMEVLSTTEKESSFQKSAPIMNPALASLFGFLNLVPGLGTFLAAHTLLCGKHCSYTSPVKGYFVGILAAFLQFLTAAVVIGWFWSLWHGIYLVRRSNEARHTKHWNRSVSSQ